VVQRDKGKGKREKGKGTRDKEKGVNSAHPQPTRVPQTVHFKLTAARQSNGGVGRASKRRK
jgi:hypothetical protein